MDDESKTTPAPGASPRPWQPVTIHGITIGVGISDADDPRMFEVVCNTLLEGESEKQRTRDSHRRAVEISRDHNDRAAHLALLRRALDDAIQFRRNHALSWMPDGYTADEIDVAFESALLEVPIIRDLRAALSGADQ